MFVVAEFRLMLSVDAVVEVLLLGDGAAIQGDASQLLPPSNQGFYFGQYVT